MEFYAHFAIRKKFYSLEKQFFSLLFFSFFFFEKNRYPDDYDRWQKIRSGWNFMHISCYFFNAIWKKFFIYKFFGNTIFLASFFFWRRYPDDYDRWQEIRREWNFMHVSCYFLTRFERNFILWKNNFSRFFFFDENIRMIMIDDKWN